MQSLWLSPEINISSDSLTFLNTSKMESTKVPKVHVSCPQCQGYICIYRIWNDNIVRLLYKKLAISCNGQVLSHVSGGQWNVSSWVCVDLG